MSYQMAIKQMISDVLIIVILQVTGVGFAVDIKLQLAGLGGAMMAVRILDGKQDLWSMVKVAFSGLVLANYAGLFWCEYRGIKLGSYHSLFILLVFGAASDILLRAFKKAGETILIYIPEIIRIIFERLKSKFL